MLSVKVDSRKVNKILENATSYSYGFIDGVEASGVNFNDRLGEFTVQALYKYIDSKARVSPERLHHVYEWDMVGKPSGRLFDFTYRPYKKSIRFTGNFLQSSSISENSTEPFANKAKVMEDQIQIVVTPRDSEYLAFELDGEMVFTTNTIYIDHPGGDAVAGSFGKTVGDFFDNYFKLALLKPFLNDLKTAEEFSQMFASGARGGGRSAGNRAGKKYMTKTGMIVE
jgi:hypothetical protein